MEQNSPGVDCCCSWLMSDIHPTILLLRVSEILHNKKLNRIGGTFSIASHVLEEAAVSVTWMGRKFAS